MVIRSAVVLNCNMSLAYALEADRHALCVCRHYMRVTTLDTNSNHYCFSKYSDYDAGLHIMFKYNLHARTKNIVTYANEHVKL